MSESNVASIALTPWASDKDQAANQQVEAEGILGEMDGIVIENQEDLEFAAETLAEIKGKVKALEKMKDRVVSPINVALTELRSWFSPALDTLGKCEKVLKRKIAKAHEDMHARQRASLQEAADASMAGDADTAAAAMEVATTHELEPIKGLSLRHTFDYKVTDIALVPLENLVVDDKRMRALIRAAKGKINIPGIEVIRKTGVSSSSR